MKKIILCVLIAISLILQTMGVASAAELSQSKIGDFEISILSEVPNIDLSGIEIDVYSAQVAFADNATGYVEYDEEFAFTVKTGEDGIVNFVKPSQAFSITIRLETLPQNLGIDNHTKFFTAEAKSYQAVLSEIAEVNISHSSGEFVPCMYDKNGNAVYADAKTEVINNGRKTLYSVDAENKRISYNQTVTVSIYDKTYTFSEDVVHEYQDNYSKIKYLFAEGLVSEDEYIDNLCQHILDDSLLSAESEINDGTELYWRLRNFLEIEIQDRGFKSFDEMLGDEVECLQDTDEVYEVYDKRKKRFHVVRIREFK